MNRHGLSRQRYEEVMAIDAMSDNQRDAYCRQRFGTDEAGLTTILSIAKSISSNHSMTKKEAHQLQALFPHSSKSDLESVMKSVNESGMPRERFLEIITSSSNHQIDLHDAIRMSDSWNKQMIEEDVKSYLDKKHAHEPQDKAVPIGSKADTSAIGSDAHRMEVRQALSNMIKFNEGKTLPRTREEARAREARGADLDGSSVQRQIAEAFERRASPHYEAPEEGSIRDHLESAFDNKIADVFEREEFGTERGIPVEQGDAN